MSIESIKIQNFKGVKSFKGQILGKDVWLIGKNGSGKTSFIEAVFLALTGKNAPPKPITKGEKKGLIEVEIEGGYIARLKLSATGKEAMIFEIENLNAEGKEEKFIKAPRTWLNNKIGVLDFDVNKFFELSDAKQVEYFCKISKIDVSDIDTQIEEITDSRKFDKQKLAKLQTQTGFYNTEEAEKEIIDIVKLSNEIKVLEEAERVKSETFTRVSNGVIARELRLKEIEIELEALNAEKINVTSEVTGGKEWLESPENIVSENKVLIQKRIEFENSNEINAKIAEAKAFKEADDEIEKLQTSITEANEEIEAEREKKAKVISEKINIDGLKYDTETGVFLFNGLPFDKTQINTASQIIAGLKIGASLLNEVKILKLDASLIDEENMKEIQAWSKAEGIELFVELVERSGKELKIVIEEEQS